MKRAFGALLTIGGIVGLIYAAFLFINTAGGERNLKMITIYGLLGFIFFVAGIGLVKGTKDEVKT